LRIKAYTLVGFFIISLLFTQYAFAETGMTVSVNADEGSTTISVSGHSSINNNDISILVSKPDGKGVSVDQVIPDVNGDFRTDILLGPLWNQDGLYTISIKQSSSALYSFTFQIEIVNGVTHATSLTDSTLESGTTTQPSITISTDKSVYKEKEVMYITYAVSEAIPNEELSIRLYDPNGDNISSTITSYAGLSYQLSTYTTFFPYDRELNDGKWYVGGTYTIIAEYAGSKKTLTVEVTTSTSTVSCGPNEVIVNGKCVNAFDDVPPLILTPSDLTLDTTYSSALVDFSVKAIDDQDGILRPNCFPSSGSLFPVGETTVTCSVTDNSGNSDRKSFIITVRALDAVIPSWIRDVAGFWCGNEIDDNSFIEAIQYLISNNVIVVPATASSGSGAQEIPNWIKNNACWWSQELISDKDFASGLQYLIEQGIIRVLQTSEPSQSTSETAIKPYEIAIVGDGTCKYKTNQALDLLRNKARIHYETVTYHVGVIECVDQGSGIYVRETPPRALVGKQIIDAGTIWYAGGMAHESCHSKLYSDYLKNNPQSVSVPSNIYSGKDAEAQCIAVQYHALVLLGATQTSLDHVEKSIESEYWNIPYEDRWW